MLFVSDIDGTMLYTRKGLTESTIDSVKAFILRGNDFTIATGRSVQATRDVALDIGVTKPCIVFGGAAIYDYSLNKSLYSKYLDSSVYDVISEILNLHPNCSVTVSEIEQSVSFRKNRILEEKGVYHDRMAPLVSFSEYGKTPIVKVLITSSDVEELMYIKTLFKKHGFTADFGGVHFLEVVDESCSKGKGIEFLSSLYDFKLKDIYAAGDSLTDVSMIDYCHMFFAPEKSKAILSDYDCTYFKDPLDIGFIELINSI